MREPTIGELTAAFAAQRKRITARRRAQGALFSLPPVYQSPSMACSFGAHADCDGFAGDDDEPFERLCGCDCHDEED